MSNDVKPENNNLDSNINDDKKISFNEYRILATEEDIKKLEVKAKPFWWENIPVFGCFSYLIRMGINQMDIDRGILRKKIAAYHLIFLFGCLIYVYAALSILTPWYQYAIYKISIDKTKLALEQNNI